MKLLLLFAALALPFAGHAQSADYPVPACRCPLQCDAMWAKVPDALESASHTRVRLATDTLVDTYPIRQIGYLHGRAIKQPQPDGSYQIVATFDSRYDQGGMIPAAQRIFNITLQDPETMRMCAGK